MVFKTYQELSPSKYFLGNKREESIYKDADPIILRRHILFYSILLGFKAISRLIDGYLFQD